MSQPARVVFAHGLEGHPNGTKARYLRTAGFQVIAPDARTLCLNERVAQLRATCAKHPGSILVGSSYGGLASMAIICENHALIRALVLCAPALHWAEPPVTDPSELRVPPQLPCVVLHGVNDSIVPIDVSRHLAAQCPHVQLLELADGHRLGGSLDAIAHAVQQVADST